MRIGLVDALRGNHIDQLRRQFHVGFLDRPRLQSAQAARLGRAHQRNAGVGACCPEIVALHLQSLRIGEIRQCNLAQVQELAIRVAAADHAIVPDVETDQLARRIAILGQGIDAEARPELGGASEVEVEYHGIRPVAHGFRHIECRRTQRVERSIGQVIQRAYRRPPIEQRALAGGEYVPGVGCRLDEIGG